MSRLDRVSEGLRVWRRFSSHLERHRARLIGVTLLILFSVCLELVRPWTVAWVLDNALVRAVELPREPCFYLPVPYISVSLGCLAQARDRCRPVRLLVT